MMRKEDIEKLVESLEVLSEEKPCTERFDSKRIFKVVLETEMFWKYSSQFISRLIVEKVADKIADYYVEKNFGDLIAKMNPDAIVNLAIARAGEKLPRKTLF